ncbi:MAG: hypothetical protein RR654_00440, partial [Oscillospiraceae bacterium]
MNGRHCCSADAMRLLTAPKLSAACGGKSEAEVEAKNERTSRVRRSTRLFLPSKGCEFKQNAKSHIMALLLGRCNAAVNCTEAERRLWRKKRGGG